MTFGVISGIDSMYYHTLKSSLKEQLESRNFELPITNTEEREKKIVGTPRFQLAFVKSIEFVYQTFYFHVFPMCIYIFSYVLFSQGDS